MSTPLHDPADPVLFPTFPPEVVDDMRRWGTVEEVAPGGVLFAEGESRYDLFVVLEGRVRITRTVDGEERLLAVHEPGGFAGEIGILTGAPAIATGRALDAAKVLRIRADSLRRMIAECTPLGETALRALTARAKDVDAQLRQQEKLTALGRMAAGLAHELNNPATAARRAAAALRDEVRAAQRRALDHDGRFGDQQREALRSLHDELVAAPARPPADALARSDVEEALALWLDQRGMPDAWECAPALVDAGLDAARLEGLDGALEAESLAAGMEWLASTLAMAGLAAELEGSAGRISALVKAIKEYSYMERGSLERLDVHDGLESTLTMLAHKLRSGITVHREYDRSLPPIRASGSELSQVWTNLVDNAAAAMQGRGSLWIRTARDGDAVRVEIADDGPGIAPEVLPRIWEPFFTTKGLGEGTGLGLDIARRIVERSHAGQIRAVSRPGDTRFSVTLPIDGPPGDGPPSPDHSTEAP